VIAVSPASKEVWQSDVFTLDILVQAGSQPVDLAEAHLNFDTTYLEVLSITPGSTLSSVLQNTYSNAAGTIDYAAGSLGTPAMCSACIPREATGQRRV